MRVVSRIALVVVLSLVSLPLLADHFTSDCPLSLVDTTPPATAFDLSPHGVFRNGSLVHVLRGQVLTTYNVNDIGQLQIAREDYIGSLAARETKGGTAFSNGYLFVSSEAGLEIYDLRNVRGGGGAPILVSRTAGMHFRRIAISGNLLAGLYPGTDLPCPPSGTNFCRNSIDLVNIANLAAPSTMTRIFSDESRFYIAFNDIAFNRGYLVAAADGGLNVFNVSNPGVPARVFLSSFTGKFLASNGSDLVGVGNDLTIDIFTMDAAGQLARVLIATVPLYLALDRANEIYFHPQAWFDESNGRMITMIDERNPMTLEPARTIAFDVFDFSVPFYEGSAERLYEDVTMTTDDEVKWNPVSVGPFIYTVGEQSGLQSWGACGQVSGRIELDSVFHLSCQGAELHGWVTGAQKIVNVELFLDNGALGAATLDGRSRPDVSTKTPVQTWRINVNLDATPRGEHILRAIGTDIFGNRRQFSSQRMFFPGPGANCTVRRRSAR
jgi:hypothetical protein